MRNGGFFVPAVCALLVAACASPEKPSAGVTASAAGRVSAKNLPLADGGTLNLADGTPSLVAVIGANDGEFARRVGAAVPDAEIARREARFVTVINFNNSLPTAFRGVTAAQIEESRKVASAIQSPLYRQLGVVRDPREDIHVVTDYDGTISKELGAAPGTRKVLLFNGDGNLLKSWSASPSTNEWQAALGR